MNNKILCGPFGGNYMGKETYSQKLWGTFFLVFHGTEVRRKRNSSCLEKSIGINIPGI